MTYIVRARYLGGDTVHQRTFLFGPFATVDEAREFISTLDTDEEATVQYAAIIPLNHPTSVGTGAELDLQHQPALVL